MHKLTETERAYIAGFTDGEGSIGIQKYQQPFRKYQEHPVIRIVQVDRTPLDWIQKVTGIGTVYSKKVYKSHYKPAFYIHIWNQDALDLLEAIEDYLIVKTDQAGFILEKFGR